MPNNIIGESFKPYVEKQIGVRQKKLSLVNTRDPDLLKYINNKTSFIRLSSGVNVTADKAKELGVPTLSGNALAQSSILFSARKYTKFTQNNKPETEWDGKFTAGVGYDLSNPSYGYTPGVAEAGVSYDYGLIPPAGIISANIKPLSQGSLREATVQITCHNLPQFKIIEALYLRLGYSMLLEWGHTFWYDNKSVLHSDLPDWLHAGFIVGHYNQDGILENLEKQREYTCGNYDGFFGRVVNFSWNFRPDGGYDVTLNMRAVGDVIESLKVNVNLSSTSPGSVPATEEDTENPPPIIANKNKSTLHKIIYSISKELDDVINTGRFLNGFERADSNETSLDTANIVNITKKRTGFDLGKPNYKDPNENKYKVGNLLTWQEGFLAKFESISSDPDESDSGGIFYYIKLGTLLRIIESYLLKYDTSKEKNGSYSPLFYIDHDFDTNICLTLPRQMSINPHICLLPPSGFIGEVGAAGKDTPEKTYIKYTFRGYGSGTFEDSYFLDEGTTSVPESEVSFNYLIASEPTKDAWSSDPTKFDSIDVILISKDAKPLGRKDYEARDYAGTSDGRGPRNLVLFRDPDLNLGGNIEENAPNRITDLAKDIYNGLKAGFTGDFNNTDERNLDRILGDGYYRVELYPFLGRFMHIHVNLDFIASTLSNNIDSEGKLSLLKFLQDIANGISQATGQINDFSVTYDELKNIFSFRDNNIPPYGYKYLNKLKPELNINDTPTKFNVNLLKSSDGSFVKDLAIKSELDNNFATMITAGAQSNGNRIGENSTALSKINVGFEDRVIPFKSSWADEVNKDSTDASQTKSPDQAYAEQLAAYVNLKEAINNGTVTEEDISNNTQAIVDMYKYQLGYSTQKGEIAGTGFIPLNLQLTMDGLSGPRLFETYTINDEILPLNYQNNIKFIIRGITHNIDVNGWATTLESFSAPYRSKLNPYTVLKDPTRKKQDNTNSNKKSGGNTGGSSESCASFKNFPEISWTVPKVGGDFPQNTNSFVIARKKAGYNNGDEGDLVSLANRGSVNFVNCDPRLIKEAATALNAWIDEVSAAGFCFTITSAFRSVARQEVVAGNNEGTNRAAKPGSSAHGWGIAIDIRELYRLNNGQTDAQSNAEARKHPGYKYLASTGAKHGWFNPYRLADNTRQEECWHFEYWGVQK